MADRDMSGSLSKNLRKEKPSHADYAGTIISKVGSMAQRWVKDGEKGKFLSLSAKPAEEPRPKPALQAVREPIERNSFLKLVAETTARRQQPALILAG